MKKTEQLTEEEKAKRNQKIRKRLARVLAVLILLLLLFLLGMELSDKAPGRVIGGEDRIEQVAEDFVADTIDIPGFGSVTVTPANPYIYLENPEKNHYYFQYTVLTEDGEELCSSDLITPGKGFNFKPADYLAAGTYDLSFQVKTYTMDDSMSQRNGNTFHAEVTVTE